MVLQPQYNRLYLEPHLTEDLNNTIVRYNMRGTLYEINLRTDLFKISAHNFSISSSVAFGIDTDSTRLEYYEGKTRTPRLVFEKKGEGEVNIDVLKKDTQGLPVWTVLSSANQAVEQTVHGLNPGVEYHLYVDSEIMEDMRANTMGSLSFIVTVKWV